MNQFVNLPNPATLWEVMKWGEAVLTATGRPDAAIDAKLLLMYVTKYDQMKLLLERGQVLQEDHCEAYKALIEKRSEGIPLQHLTHEQEFMGYRFYVNEHVLVPRQDTETLIETIMDWQGDHPIKSGIDIGTGSGCIGISLCKLLPDLSMTLVDISEEALKVAAYNVKMHELTSRISLLQSDMLNAYTGEKVDLIVSNPPYIALKDMDDLMIEVKDHEPHLALTDGGDGLYFYREITKAAKAHLKNEGLLAYEIGYDQGDAVSKIMTEAGYENVTVYQDLAGNDRVVIGKYKWSGL